MPDRVVEARKSVGSERIYDVTYSIDDHGLRITPGVKASTAARGAFLFFGCSFTFGEGLNDDETLPYDFARELGFAYPVVNLGFSGYGPHQMLKRIESGMLDAVVSGPVRAAVYVALPSHVDRAAGRAWWDPVGPKYLLDSQGIARYAGPFMRVPEPLVPMFYQLLQRIETGPSLLAGRVVDLVLGARADDLPLRIRTFTGIVARAAQLLKQRYRAKLSILYWDDRSALSEAILTSLAASNFQTIKVSEIIPLGRREAYQIPKDWHPTAAANELLAKELSKRILTDGVRSCRWRRPSCARSRLVIGQVAWRWSEGEGPGRSCLLEGVLAGSSRFLILLAARPERDGPRAAVRAGRIRMAGAQVRVETSKEGRAQVGIRAIVPAVRRKSASCGSSSAMA